ncbi:MAG: class I SAM-dependent methyltransferase [Candidatus Omnitrophota bacterium]|nr:class I SAM-dependent methyltransferase [Candidatus Omnitrophota bacterium]
MLRPEKLKGFVTPEKMKHHAELLANRIRKQFRHLSRRFRRQNIDCFRLYDWDIPEIRAVVDWYAGHVVIGEYERLQTTQDWLSQMAAAVGQALNLPMDKIHLKRRHTMMEGRPRYRRMSRPSQLNVDGTPLTSDIGKAGNSLGKRFEVSERNLRFWVNMDDFLDTGLYSDHRDTRVIVRNIAAGKDFLNLYAYTGAFTCAAAAGEAKTTVTVDRSETYLNWAQDNLKLNGLWGPRHTLVQSDAMRYLAKAQREGQRFTLAFVDPPSFFRERSRGVAFDISEDHPELIRNVLKVMAPGALVLFSTNHQRFEPNFHGLAVKEIKELTPKTIPEDYRNRRVHRCWQMVAA